MIMMLRRMLEMSRARRTDGSASPERRERNGLIEQRQVEGLARGRIGAE
jgi:hypothetical protein